MGIWHDARLYAVEALARLQPGVFDRDLFLAFGSQGQYTLFPGMFAALIDAVGLEPAALALTLAGKLLWLAALAVLARRMLPSPYWAFGALLVLAYPPNYDGFKIFAYAESFATPRIFAEALTLLALAGWLFGRLWAAWAAILLAALMHPLMAMAGACFLGLMTLYHFRQRPAAWVAAALAVLAIPALLLLSPELQARLLAVYDPAWLEAILLRNPYVFVDQWNATAWGRLVWIATVLGLVAWEEKAALRKLALGLLTAMAGLLLLSWLGTSVWHSVFLTQVQLWRGVWLAQIVALVLLAGLLPRLWRAGYADRILASCLAATLLLDTWAMGLMAVAGIVLWQLIRLGGARIDTRGRLWRVLPYLIVLPWLLTHLSAIPYWILAYSAYLDQPAWRTLLADSVTMIGLGLALYWAFGRLGETRRKLTVTLSAGVLALSAMTWGWLEQTTPSRFDAAYAQLKADIPAGSVVASAQGDASLIWFRLGRASYASLTQMAGLLFNRETALEAMRRVKLYEQAGLPYLSLNRWGSPAEDNWRERVSTQSVLGLCRDPGLDFILLPGQWEHAKAYRAGKRQVFSLLACKDYRVATLVPLRPK